MSFEPAGFSLNTTGSKSYVSFYVDSASKGYIVKQDGGEKFYCEVGDNVYLSDVATFTTQ